MSERERTGLLNVQLRDSTDKQVWKKAEEAVAEERGVSVDDLSRPEVANELARAYLRRQVSKGGARYGGQSRKQD